MARLTKTSHVDLVRCDDVILDPLNAAFVRKVSLGVRRRGLGGSAAPHPSPAPVLPMRFRYLAVVSKNRQSVRPKFRYNPQER
jgi:hypothetical protein